MQWKNTYGVCYHLLRLCVEEKDRGFSQISGLLLVRACACVCVCVCESVPDFESVALQSSAELGRVKTRLLFLSLSSFRCVCQFDQLNSFACVCLKRTSLLRLCVCCFHHLRANAMFGWLLAHSCRRTVVVLLLLLRDQTFCRWFDDRGQCAKLPLHLKEIFVSWLYASWIAIVCCIPSVLASCCWLCAKWSEKGTNSKWLLLLLQPIQTSMAVI